MPTIAVITRNITAFPVLRSHAERENGDPLPNDLQWILIFGGIFCWEFRDDFASLTVSTPKAIPLIKLGSGKYRGDNAFHRLIRLLERLCRDGFRDVFVVYDDDSGPARHRAEEVLVQEIWGVDEEVWLGRTPLSITVLSTAMTVRDAVMWTLETQGHITPRGTGIDFKKLGDKCVVLTIHPTANQEDAMSAIRSLADSSHKTKAVRTEVEGAESIISRELRHEVIELFRLPE